MSDVIYKVIFSGAVSDGVSQESAKQKLAQLYKKDLAWAERLFSGKPVTIKSTNDLKEAMKYARAFKQCGAETEISRDMAGTAAKQQAPADNSKPEPDKIEQIKNAFNGEIEPLRPELSYRIGITLVAIGMILLPLLYLSSAVAVGYGVYLFATSADVLGGLRHGSWMGLVAYSGIIAGGIATILFMLKPIFARFGSEPPRYSLSQMNQQPIYELVEQIAEKVGAPVPAEIVIDGDLNASASLIDGALRKRELRLTIGLPLVMVTNANQLSGIIAHELGHFSQTAGMGMTTLIWRINRWFYLSASGQDPWDYKLKRLQERASDGEVSDEEFVNNILSIILAIVQACLWVSRKIIAIFWKAGELFSASISRQMEFDADRYETHLVGSNMFRSTSLRFAEAGLAFQRALDAFSYVLNSDNQLVDNFPKLTQLAIQQVSAEEAEKVRQATLRQTTGMFDSHPCTKARIEAALKEKSEGIFHLEKESSWLFENFEELSKKHTLWHYRNVMEIGFDRSQLIEAEELFEKDKQTTEEWNAMREHPLATLPYFFPVPVQTGRLGQKADSIPEPEQLKTMLKENQQKIEQLETGAKLANKQFARAEERIYNLKHALFLSHAGIPFDAKAYRLKDCEEGTIYQALEKAERLLEEAKAGLDSYAKAHSEEFLLTAQLLGSDAGNSEKVEELNTLLQTLATLEEKKRELSLICDDSQIISSLGDYFDDERYQATLHTRVNHLYTENGKRLQRLFQQLGQASFPFEYGGKAKRTLADYLFPNSPSFIEAEHVWNHMNNIPQGFFALRGRVLGRVLQITSEATAGISN